MMPKHRKGETILGFFTEEEQLALRVERMIIHLVAHDDDKFIEQPEAPVQEEGFFKARILSEASDALHSFDEGSLIRPILESMARDETSFEAGGQRLARLFTQLHVKQATSGAFFVFQLGVDDSTRFYALIKYDYREVVELTKDTDGKSILRSIVQAFVKDRRAIQKICVVRLTNGVAEEMVSAADRMHVAPDLTDYFARYLGVSRSRTDEELSKRLEDAIRGSMTDLKGILPPGGVGNAIRRMKRALEGLIVVANDNVVEAALFAADNPDDEERRAHIEATVRKHLRKKKLDDVAFKPTAKTFHSRHREYVKTQEEVTIEWPAEQLGQSVVRDEDGGYIIFTVKTRQIVDDGTVPDKSG